MDSSTVPLFEGNKHEVDTCIVGGGPAGLVIASTLAARGHSVCVIESGGRVADAQLQMLNAGDLAGDEYAGLVVTRYRRLGGTVSLWNTPAPTEAGAKYAPLDQLDLEPRWSEAPQGWPLSYATLQSYYEKAQRVCGIGGFEGSIDGGMTAPALPPPMALSVYQFGTARALLDPLLTSIDRSSSCRLLLGATITAIADGKACARLSVRLRDGQEQHVVARRVVLATGAIENARLLLLASAGIRGLDASGWLGRGFMEHPRDRSITLTVRNTRDYHNLGFFDAHVDARGNLVGGRIALDTAFLRREGLLNASVTLLPNVRPYRAKVRELMRRARLKAPARWLPPGGQGWSRHPAAHSVFGGMTALINLEQPPHRENAISLGARKDMFGNPLPQLHWRWHDADQQRLETIRQVVARSLEEYGFGVSRNPNERPDPNAHHHAGTTRMHDDPAHGVVDANCRVHGAPSIYVAGASVFPTCGFANPTLTIVAMALRLADHLSS